MTLRIPSLPVVDISILKAMSDDYLITHYTRRVTKKYPILRRKLRGSSPTISRRENSIVIQYFSPEKKLIAMGSYALVSI